MYLEELLISEESSHYLSSVKVHLKIKIVLTLTWVGFLAIHFQVERAVEGITSHPTSYLALLSKTR